MLEVCLIRWPCSSFAGKPPKLLPGLMLKSVSIKKKKKKEKKRGKKGYPSPFPASQESLKPEIVA